MACRTRFTIATRDPECFRAKLMQAALRLANMGDEVLEDIIVETEHEIEDPKAWINWVRAMPRCIRFCGWDTINK